MYIKQFYSTYFSSNEPRLVLFSINQNFLKFPLFSNFLGIKRNTMKTEYLFSKYTKISLYHLED